MVGSGRVFSYINSTLHVTVDDGREMTGTFLAFDRHMNLVLSETVETRPLSVKNPGAKRELGLVLLRGEHVVSIRAEKKVPAAPQGAPSGPGVAVPVGRGVPVLPGKKAALQS